MNVRSISLMLAVASALSATSVFAASPWAPQGDKGWPCQGETFCNPGPMDPADGEALLSTVAAEPEADVGFGYWAGSEAGAQQPGKGAPFSGPRPRN